jgi:hypothetical protein
MSEIFFMIIMPLCFARLGVKWMLAIGMLAWAVRYGLFAWAAGQPAADHGTNLAWLIGDGRVALPIFLGILLHGICYDFFFVTGFIYTEREAPKELRASAQGFLVLITQGVGMLIGAQVIGRIVNAYTSESADGPVVQWQSVWLIACIAAGAVLLAFLALFRDRGSPQAHRAVDPYNQP